MNKRAYKIKIALQKKGISQRDIAKELKISDNAISLYVRGTSHSSNFDEWLIKNLGEAFYNSLKKVS
jgi:transcriptional regulator with XRE-family HTH domain